VLKSKAIIRLAFLGSIIAWLILVFSDIMVLFSDMKGLPPGVPVWLPRVMLDLFIICLFYYYKYRVERDEGLNFTDLLWKVFATGLIATVVSLVFRLGSSLLGTTKLVSNILFTDFIYQINLALFISFLLAAYTSWKRLILYQKSKWLIRTWLVFEFCLFIVLIYDSLQISIPEMATTLILVVIGLLVIVLSANMRWVAYLNFKQKWTCLLLLLLSFFYLGYFIYTVSRLSESISSESPAFLDFNSHIFNLCLLVFVLVYSTFSFLVILFNLPTSSVFEQKLEEVVNFQRISQSIQTEQNEESVYNILLESSVSSVFADAAWLEIQSANDGHKLFTYKITERESKDIRDHLKSHNIKGALEQSSDRTRNLSKHLASLKGARFRSLLAFPITVKGETIGTLALLKELPEGFNKEMTRIVSAFANQAGISIENFRLMEEAFQTERYKEELKIAKTVQKSLLPTSLEAGSDFEISAFAESADEVGGDYYDTLRINDYQVALIIADVSGKGTTAAFHMSQMKGIFHSLAQQELDPKEFMERANRALVFCLERGSFISATYFVVDSKTKTIRYSRAGHCPVLYFKASAGTTEFLKDKGTALGMVRSRDYCKFVETNEIPYAPGDIMVLYTDGITEAKNQKGEEFDYPRLEAALKEVTEKSSQEIENHIIQRLYEFSGSSEINDDYTSMTIKFK
jgi:serine phosphatase RsbU (regulator of sigma subunit)